MTELHPDAHALRPVRIIGDALRLYEGTTFPRDPWDGCQLYVRRLQALGHLKGDGTGILLDVLAATGDIVQDFPLSRPGLTYLRRQLRFRVEKEGSGT